MILKRVQDDFKSHKKSRAFARLNFSTILSIFFLSYFKIAATPGNSLPSNDSNIAPPPVET